MLCAACYISRGILPLSEDDFQRSLQILKSKEMCSRQTMLPPQHSARKSPSARALSALRRNQAEGVPRGVICWHTVTSGPVLPRGLRAWDLPEMPLGSGLGLEKPQCLSCQETWKNLEALVLDSGYFRRRVQQSRKRYTHLISPPSSDSTFSAG